MKRLTKQEALEQARSLLMGLYSESRGMSQEEYLSRVLMVAYERGRLDGAFPGEEDGNE
jgi:hypothetical protein